MAAAPGNVDSYYVIIDCYQMSRVNINIEFVKTFMTTMSYYYPSRSCKLFILHVNWVVRSIYAILSPLLNDITKKKVSAEPPTHCLS